MKKYLVMLWAAISLAACDKGNNGAPGSIELTGGTQTSQTVYADETGKGDGIKFSAKEAWTASVSALAGKAGGSAVEWLSLSRYEGGAGEFTLGMTLQPNNTGADRKAEIRIACANTTVTINVEQKGTTQGGEQPQARIARIVTKELQGSTYKYLSETVFTYDARARLVKAATSDGKGADQYLVFTYDYATGKLKSDFHEGHYENGVWEYSETEEYTVTLDSEGNATQVKGTLVYKRKGEIRSTAEVTNRFTYKDGYLETQYFHQTNKPTGGQAFEDGPIYTSFVWKDGNLMAQQERDSKVSYGKFEYGTLPNNANLDLNLMLTNADDGMDYAIAFTKMGNRSKNRISKFLFTQNEASPAKSKSGSDDEYATLTYDLDPAGRVSKIYMKTPSGSGSEYITLFEVYYE